MHVAEAAKKGPSAGNGGPLRRLVTALGGKVKLPVEPCCLLKAFDMPHIFCWYHVKRKMIRPLCEHYITCSTVRE